MEDIKNYKVKIVTGQYQKAPIEQQEMINSLFGENAEYNYEIYFHWYNLLHELGHAIMMFNSSTRPHPAEEEQLVNNFAFAYWLHYGEQKKLNDFVSIVNDTIQKFTVPATDYVSYMEYAKENWGTDTMCTFNNYGWFQFSCVQTAIIQKQSLEQALMNMCAFKVSPQEACTLEYLTYDKMAIQVVSDATKVLKKWGIFLPKNIDISFCNDVNCHMCQVENINFVSSTSNE